MTPKNVDNLNDAILVLKQKLELRELEVTHMENLSSQGKYGNARIYTSTDEIFHLKYTKKGYIPKDSTQVSAAAKELDEKLKFAINLFGFGDKSINGIDIDLLLFLLEEIDNGKACYFITILSNGTTLWCAVDDFYNFVMRYDTFFKFPRSNVPVCEVPMGWLRKWEEPLIGLASICKDFS